jgi:hypothetical protein
MSNVATKQDITELRGEIKESFSDITSLLQIFMQQVDDRFTQVEAEQVKSRHEIAKVLDHLDSLLKSVMTNDLSWDIN